ncbi:hypothetical protein [Virgibacillus sp. SK37]|nr:hypothetical protein [Virgibacillus sp. SK37]
MKKSLDFIQAFFMQKNDQRIAIHKVNECPNAATKSSNGHS